MINFNKAYFMEEVLNNDNLIFDIKYDSVFKNVFLNEDSRRYLVLFFSELLGYEYKDLNNNMVLSNIEMPSKINGKSSYSDLVCKYKNKNIIIEMNNNKSRKLINKNYHYLFKQHSSRNNNKNNYGVNNETILINIDNYDVLNKKQFIYESNLRFKIYNMCIYKNIKIIHINLAYLRWKYYNKVELNKLEKILFIFVCQKKDEIRKVIKREEIEDNMNMIDRLKFEEHNGIVTYDREEFEKILKEEFEEDKRKLEKSKRKFERQQSNFKEQQSNFREQQSNFKEQQTQFEEKQTQFKKLQINLEKQENQIKEKQNQIKEKQNQFEKRQNQFKKRQNIFKEKTIKFNKERMAFAKELKSIGTPIDRIIKITDLTQEQINMI